MKLPTCITEDDERGRLIDLVFSLNDCLGEFYSLVLVFDGIDDQNVDYDLVAQSLSREAMNILGDMVLLEPLFNEIRTIRYEPPVSNDPYASPVDDTN